MAFLTWAFTSNLSMYKMAESASTKAKRVLAYLFNSFNESSYIPVKTFFKVFDAKVCSFLFYGSEIWGLKPINCIEKLQTYACKRLLNVNDQCCNDAILGDLGDFPCTYTLSKDAHLIGLGYSVYQKQDT